MSFPNHFSEIFGSRSVCRHLFQCCLNFITQPGITFFEANAIFFCCDHIIQDFEICLTACNLITCHNVIHCDRIHCPGFQIHKCRVVICNRCQASKRGSQLTVVVQCCFCTGIRLDFYVLSGQICLRIDVRISTYNEDLIVFHIRLAPLIVVFTAIHGEAIPDTVNSFRHPAPCLLHPRQSADMQS